MFSRRSITNNWLSIFAGSYLLVFIRLLWYPGKGGGVMDTTAIPLFDQSTLQMVILTEVIICFILAILQIQNTLSKTVKYLHIGILLFICYIVINACIFVELGSTFLTANILLGPTAFYIYCCLSETQLVLWYPMVLILTLIRYVVDIFATLPSNSELSIYHYAMFNRLSAIFDHPNHLGNLLAFGIILCFVMSLMTHTYVKKVALWFLLVPLLYFLIHTFSRGAFLGCILGTIISLLLLYRHCTLNKLISYSCILLVTTAILLYISSCGTAVYTRTLKSNISHDAAVGNRFAVWHSALMMISDHWIIGVGISRFSIAMDEGYKPVHLSHYSYKSALNNYLTLAAETGIPGLLLYMIPILIAISIAVRQSSNTYSDIGIRIGLIGGIISLLVFALTTYTLVRVYANLLLWTALAYTCVFRRFRTVISELSERLFRRNRTLFGAERRWFLYISFC